LIPIVVLLAGAIAASSHEMTRFAAAAASRFIAWDGPVGAVDFDGADSRDRSPWILVGLALLALAAIASPG